MASWLSYLARAAHKNDASWTVFKTPLVSRVHPIDMTSSLKHYVTSGVRCLHTRQSRMCNRAKEIDGCA